MFCSQCGNKIDDEAIFCAHCGTRVTRRDAVVPQSYAAPSVQPQYVEQRQAQCNCNNCPKNKSANDNVVGLVGFILAFLCPLAGLICSIIGYNNAKNGAPNRGLSIAGIIISAVEIGICVLYCIGMFALFMMPIYYL